MISNEPHTSTTQRERWGECKVTLTDWNELYRRTYEAYNYASFCNEEVRETLGTLLDQLIDTKSKETK